MSEKIPIIRVKAFETLLFELGFKLVRKKGSHAFYRHPDGRYTTLAHHGNREIGRALTRQILREIQIAPKEFREILKNL
jgi:predicted RNA binding protein YcfA (HicA-like mRNA interferase family)